MKSLFTLLIICIYSIGVHAQEVNFKTIEGTWDYKSPKGKTKMSYKFEEDNKFTSVTERKENETQMDGSYTFDKVGDLDRLIISHTPKEDGTKTITSYYLIKFSGMDTIKTQHVNSKQQNWLRETPKTRWFLYGRKKGIKVESKN